MTRSSPAHLVVFNELTLFRALWLIAGGHDVYILRTTPHLRLLMAPLQRLAALLIRRGWVHEPDDIDPRMVRLDGILGDNGFNHLLDDIETDLLSILLPPGKAAGVLGDYDYAMKKTVELTAQGNVYEIFSITTWMDANRSRPWILHGSSPLVALMHTLIFGTAHGFRCGSVAPMRLCANVVNALTSMASVTRWLLARARRRVATRHYLLGLDVNGDAESLVLQNVIDDPSQALVVYRGQAFRDSFGHLYASYPYCYPEDCHVDFRRAVVLLGTAARDLAALVWNHGAGDCALFTGYCGLVSSKVRMEVFHGQYQFDFFWGRDDYNPHHIFRSQIMRRSGGKTLGINHGLPLTTITAEWRQIDYDLYYTYGSHLYENYYRGSWPGHMRIVPVGNIHFTPERRRRVSEPRPHDIAYFVTSHPHLEQIIAEVFTVARHFPDRKVYIKMKARRRWHDRDVYEAMMASAPPNVVRVDETQSPYEMMFDIGYCITSSSTLGAEALQFRVVSFIFDLLPEIRFLYADFPKLIVKSGQEITRRIEDIESGREHYRFEDFDALMKTSGPCIFGVIRSDMGLPPRGATLSAVPEITADAVSGDGAKGEA